MGTDVHAATVIQAFALKDTLKGSTGSTTEGTSATNCLTATHKETSKDLTSTMRLCMERPLRDWGLGETFSIIISYLPVSPSPYRPVMRSGIHDRLLVSRLPISLLFDVASRICNTKNA